jgi:hypothetical protein
MPNSFIAVYRSTDGRPLLGGIFQSQSSRFEREVDAQERLRQVIKMNGPHCEGEVVSSDLYPEVFIHCGRVPQGIAGRCFVCGKLLTVADAEAKSEST